MHYPGEEGLTGKKTARFLVAPLVERIARQGMATQTHRKGDHVNADGLLVCGQCGQLRQIRRTVPDPTEEEPDRRKEVLLPVMCRCDEQEEALKAKEEADRKAMDEIRDLRRSSLMDRRFEAARFENFTVRDENDRVLKRLCVRYADRFSEMTAKGQGLLFWGNIGSGKSFAAGCIANSLLEQKVPVIMTSFVKVLEAFQQGGDAETAMLHAIRSAKLAIFDDLGAERSTSYALEKVYGVINDRYVSCRPMILTTNLTLDQIQRETRPEYSRIYDRILSCCFPVQLNGKSWRRAEARDRYNEMRKLLEGLQ